MQNLDVIHTPRCGICRVASAPAARLQEAAAAMHLRLVRVRDGRFADVKEAAVLTHPRGVPP